MIPDASSARAAFGLRFVTLSRRWRRVVQSALADAGLTDATWAPLVHLDADGDGISQTALAERLGIDGSTLVRLIDLLEGRGLIVRRVDADDRRARQVFLTPEGEAAVAQIRAQILEVETRMLAGLDDATVATLLAAFTQIGAAVDAALSDPAR